MAIIRSSRDCYCSISRFATHPGNILRSHRIFWLLISITVGVWWHTLIEMSIGDADFIPDMALHIID